jgi:hypothetical protein
VAKEKSNLDEKVKENKTLHSELETHAGILHTHCILALDGGKCLVRLGTESTAHGDRTVHMVNWGMLNHSKEALLRPLPT